MEECDRLNLLARSRRSRLKVWPGRWAALLVLFSCAAWIGCTPQKRYQTLSFFFDGVPNPDAAGANKNASSAGASLLHAGRAALPFQHKPFAEGNCASCHPSGDKIDAVHVKQGCMSCHKNVENQYAVMHEPVATGECLWCHLPHESVEPHLLAAASQKLCRQCHNLNMLSANPPAHLDEQRSCLDCHLGHGGSTPALLKPVPIPATLPTTVPATAPADGGPS